MTTPHSTDICRSEADYERMLRLELTAQEELSLRRHLDRCPKCARLVNLLQSELGQPTAQPPAIADTLINQAKPTAHPPAAAPILQQLAPAEGALGQLGQYRLLRVLGAGGMGVVFLAEDTQLHRQVAVKTMQPALVSNADAAQRFVREARLMASLKHDNVVTIYQVGQERGLSFLVMELLRGESLKSRMQRLPQLTLAESLRIGREIALALTAAHQVGLVHRDIKPDNVWLEEGTGRVKILDFGLARLSSADDVRMTQSGLILGTPAYMAPEQAKGQTVDARTDLFSLGCVLYEMCSGQLPFRGDSAMATLLAITNESPVPVRQINPQLPSPLGDLVMRLLAKNPEQRPPSAAAVVEGLEALMPSPGGRHRAPTARRVSPVFAAGFLLLVVGLCAVAFLYGERAWLYARGRGQLVVNPQGLEFAVAIWDERGDLVAKGDQSSHELPPGSYGVELKVQDPAAAGEWEPIWKDVRLQRGDSLTLDLARELKLATASDPRQKTLGVVAHAEGKMRHEGTVYGLAFSPDGRALASAGQDRQVRVWAPESGEALLSIAGHGDEVHGVAFRPQGNQVASASSDGKVRVWQFTRDDGALKLTPQPVFTFSGRQDTAFTNVAFRPDGSTLAAANTDQVVRWWGPLLAKGPTERRKELTSQVWAVAFDRTGDLLAGGSNDGTVRVWSPATGRDVATWKAHAQRVQELAFHPRRAELATCGHDGKARAWEPEGKKLLREYGSQSKRGPLTSVCYSPDGRWLATAAENQKVVIYSVGTGADELFLRKAGQVVRFSPDGKWLAAGGTDGWVRMWDVTSLK